MADFIADDTCQAPTEIVRGSFHLCFYNSKNTDRHPPGGCYTIPTICCGSISYVYLEAVQRHFWGTEVMPGLVQCGLMQVYSKIQREKEKMYFITFKTQYVLQSSSILEIEENLIITLRHKPFSSCVVSLHTCAKLIK